MLDICIKGINKPTCAWHVIFFKQSDLNCDCPLLVALLRRVASFVTCNLGLRFRDVLMTVLGFFNLDFFHATLPPSCVNTSPKVIDIPLFDFVVAIYSTVLTAIILVVIELYDRKNVLIVFL